MGPYNSEREARAEPMPQAVKALHNAGKVRSGDPDRLVRNTVLDALLLACHEAGINLGDYDTKVLVGIARGETSTAQVLIGLISRAFEAGKTAEKALLAVADNEAYVEPPEPFDDWSSEDCPDCQCCSRGMCNRGACRERGCPCTEPL